MTEEEAIAKRNRLDREIKSLETAYNNIQTEQENAKAERKKVSDAFRSVRKWKGTTYNTVKALGLKEKYDPWVNSINAAMDKINSVKGSKQGTLGSIWSWIQNGFN